MLSILQTFADYALAGLLAESGLLADGAAESFEAVLSYELWRHSFMAGGGELVSSDGQKLTSRDVSRQVRQRRKRVRSPRLSNVAD